MNFSNYVMRDQSKNVVSQVMINETKVKKHPVGIAEVAIFITTISTYLLMLTLTA